MTTLFLHGLKNSLGFQSRYQDLDNTDSLKSFNISWIPIIKEEKAKEYLLEFYQYLILAQTIDPLQFCTSNPLIKNIFVPLFPPIASIGLSYSARSGNKQAQDVKKELKKLCLLIHVLTAIYLFSTEKKPLALGLLAGHFIGSLKPAQSSPHYDFCLFIVQAGTSLYLGSIYDKVANIGFLLLNYPKQCAEGIEWLKSKIFKPQK